MASIKSVEWISFPDLTEQGWLARMTGRVLDDGVAQALELESASFTPLHALGDCFCVEHKLWEDAHEVKGDTNLMLAERTGATMVGPKVSTELREPTKASEMRDKFQLATREGDIDIARRTNRRVILSCLGIPRILPIIERNIVA